MWKIESEHAWNIYLQVDSAHDNNKYKNAYYLSSLLRLLDD